MTTDLENRVARLESNMETIQATLQQIAQLQMVNTQASNRLTERMDSSTEQINSLVHQADSLNKRVDSFVFEAQRLFARLGESNERSKATLETLTALANRSDRELIEQRARFEASQQRQDAMIERLDGLVNYLMRQP